MSHKIIRYEITNDCQEQVEIETTGDLKYMPQNVQMVRAIFGCFERTGNKTLLYSASIAREKDGTILHDYDSEYVDDYNALKSGRIDIVY